MSNTNNSADDSLEEGLPFSEELAQAMRELSQKSGTTSLFSEDVEVVTVRQLFGRLAQYLSGAREITAVHELGSPGSLTIAVIGADFEIRRVHPDVQVVLPYTEGADTYYEVSIQPVESTKIQSEPYGGIEGVRNRNDNAVYDTIDTTNYSPVMLPEGLGGDLALTDGVEYLRRKMYHQLNGGEVEPKPWGDVLWSLRDGELDTTGMFTDQ